MEAANLGAWVAPHPDAALDAALDVLGRWPDFAPDIRGWAAAAFDVRSAWPDGASSLGIPTWHYGHEPPNAFATHIAKYFRNAVREDVLLALAQGGVIFLPGAAGTVEEIFTDATGNYYGNTPAPMVLVDRAYWTDQLPAWPLLSALARGRDMDGSVHVVDTAAEAAAVIIGTVESSVPPRS
jgi:predicted Rossmann-fold nucleotide-binding protein